jgi:hypothetical protein
MFFGTLEIAWMAPKDTLEWGAGCDKAFHKRLKPPTLVLAVQQVPD